METTSDATTGRRLGGSSRPLVQVYDTGLLDLDGVVYIAGEPVAESPRHLARAVAEGLTAAFVTNNASRTPPEVAERLRRIGIECRSEDVVTSAQAAARLVSRRVGPGARVLVVGGPGLAAALEEHGLVPVSSLDDEPVAVAQGFHPDVGWRLLAQGTAAVERGLPWIASNTDLTVPTRTGRAPGNGLLVDVIARTTGRRPEVAGKPATPLFEETMLRVGGERPLVVGDRLDTDIEGAVAFGCPSLLVLTGVTDVVRLAAAPAGSRPTYLATDLSGLFSAHPGVDATPDEARCGGWTAHVAAGGPALGGRGRALNAARALVSLCWARTDAGHVSEGPTGPTGPTGADRAGAGGRSAAAGTGPHGWPENVVAAAWHAVSEDAEPVP